MAVLDVSNSHAAHRKFVKRAMATPLLHAEREMTLARAWRDQADQKALHELISAYFRLVVSVASRFRNYGLPMGDLVQEGVIGLMQAAQRFEPEREVRFSTYATWWIRASIQDYVLRNWSIVRLTSTAAQKSLFFNLRRLRALIGDRPGHALSPKAAREIATKLKVSVRDVEDMDGRLTGGDRSLNAKPVEDTDSEWQDLLADDTPSPEDQVILSDDADMRRRRISEALRTLSPRELTIIRERRLHDEDEGVTLEALGKRLGISKERVRQIEASALEKLKKLLMARGDAPALGYDH
ncbi:MAG TPA: RNA polymerase factor sigma-32 [Alphaproteobacteria bacterium]|nr:RNA polymerase factor sigma-32 [Alphaproteobacteria bacterium]HAJ48221.1 RNA polymerase factor sigma-32 [Alphaproteobacteria bacterium]